MRYVGAIWERIKEFKIPNLMEIFLMERWKIAIFCRLNERRESKVRKNLLPWLKFHHDLISGMKCFIFINFINLCHPILDFFLKTPKYLPF